MVRVRFFTMRVAVLILAFGGLASLAHADLVLLGTPTTVQASSEYSGAFAVSNLFDGPITAADIGTTNNLGNQYAGGGIGPHTVYMDYGSSITADSFVFSQRAGTNAALDKVTQIEFWFESSDPGGPTVPARAADEIVTMSNTADAILTPETFADGPFSSQYVIMHLTGNGGNPGGSEFRFGSGDYEPPPPPVYINQEIPLTVDEVNTTDTRVWATGMTTKAGLVNDPFAYNPDDPTLTSPAQGWNQNVYCTTDATGGIVDLYFDAAHNNIMLDIWGRIVAPQFEAEMSRHKDLTITFYNGDVQQHQVTGFNGVTGAFDDPAAFGRYTPPADVLADRVTIGHTSDFLLLAEVRAATLPGGLTWDGDVDDNWAMLGNWSDDAAIPDQATVASVGNGDTVVVSTAAPGEAARDLLIDDGGITVAASGVLSVTDEVAVAAAGSLSVAGGGTLNAEFVNTAGMTTFATGSLGTIGTVNVTGATANVSGTTITTLNARAGTLNIVADVTNLNVDGGAVNVTGASSADRLNLDDGAITMAADLDVTTASLRGGTLDTGTNRIVVHEALTVLSFVKFGIDENHSFAAGTSNPWLSNDLTLSGGKFTIDSLSGPTPIVPTGGLVSQWRFEDPADLGYDSATPDRTRTEIGTPAHTWEGRFGGALLLDGNSHIETSSEGFQQAYSVSAWLTVADVVGLNDWRTAAGFWEDRGTYWMHFGKEASGDFFGDQGGYPGPATVATDPFSRDTWYHVVSIRDGMENQLWIDGEMVATSTTDLPPSPGPAFLIGAKNVAGANHWIGMIDELHIYDRALTPDDVAQLYEPSVVGVELQLETVNLTVTEDTQIDAGVDGVTLGNLTVADGVNSLALGGAVYSFQNASFAGSVTLDGELEVRTVLDMGDGDGGTLTLGDSELVLGPDATCNAKLSVAGQVGDADTITLAGSSSELSLDGVLMVSSMNDRDANDSWSDEPVTIVDNGIGEGSIGRLDEVTDLMVNHRFASVSPENGAHLGQGVFLRGVEYVNPPGAENVTTSVDLDLLIALGGDADGDGKVWLSDWAALRANFGNTGT
ncbi:MAG: LamG domain-containing protein, partial [Candidatus Nealsonbacteria bacterium]|nr:LamG domain-containing protein [Candidatus Nealsonbacteria bacterium]